MSISVYDMHCHFINTLPDLMLYIFSIHKHMPNNKHSILGAIGYVMTRQFCNHCLLCIQICQPRLVVPLTV